MSLWTEETVQTLLEQPHTLLKQEPWRTWVAERGGLDAVYQRLTRFPVAERERQVLNLLLAQPGLTNKQYAAMLHMHRVTFQRTLRRLFATVSTHLAAQAAGPPAARPPLAPPAAPGAPLPLPMTPLIGRTHEVAAICTWLHDPAKRLITLVGPGGIGKTRLAIQVARDMSAEFADGIVFIPLTPIRDPALVVPAIARACGIHDEGDHDLLTRLQTELAPRQRCLVIDNAEHLLSATPAFNALLSAAPRLTILVTSRVRLDLYGEHLFDVPPLAVPPLESAPSFEHLLALDAVRLFGARAQAIAPGFQLAPDTIRLVHAICLRLDGLALAIELAATHVRHYGLQPILERLEQRLAFLTNGPRDAEPRHQTLMATIAWSDDLLPPAAQRIFHRLGALADGWTLDALTSICTDTSAALEAETALRTLLDHHLIYQESAEEAEPRFGMLETIREYALNRLREAGEEPDTRARHLRYYVQMTEPLERALLGAEQLSVLKRFHAAYPNIRDALAWSLAADPAGAGLQIAGALWRYWEMSDMYTEGLTWLRTMLDAAGDLPAAPAYVRALQGLARSYTALNNFAPAIPVAERALALARASDDAWRTASILNDLGVAWSRLTEYDRASGYYQESLDLRRALDDQGEIEGSLMSLGTLAFRMGDYAEAQRSYAEALTIARTLGDTVGMAMLLNNLGAAAAYLSDYRDAEARLREALPLRIQLGHNGGIVMTTTNLAWVCVEQGKLGEAWEYLRQSLRRYDQSEEIAGLIEIIEIVVRICLREDRVPEAMYWYGVADAVRTGHSLTLDQGEQEWHTATIMLAQSRLGGDRLRQVLAQGRGMPESDIVAALLAAADGAFRPSPRLSDP